MAITVDYRVHEQVILLMFELFTPPRWFKDVTFHRHTNRSVGWLELFYDLVYVATLIQIGNFLSDNLSLVGFGQFLILLVVVWWAWSGETFYQNRYVVDDLKHRLLVFTQIFAVATLGLSVSQAFGDLYVQFTLAYVVTRFILILMYIRAGRAHPESREFVRGYVIGFSTGIVVWLCSLLLPAEIHWVGWIAGIIVELLIPLTPKMRRLFNQLGTDIHHISERFGIFTIIVLGESFVKILDDGQGSTLGTNEFLFSCVGFVVFFSLWWLYFSDTAGKLIDFSHRWKPVAWVYGHFPLSVGLVAFAVGAKKLFASNIEYADKAANPEYRLLYTTAVVFYLVALALIDYGVDDETTPKSQRMESVVHIVGAVIITVIGLTATGATPIMFVGMLAVVMTLQVIYSIYLSRQIEMSQVESG